MPKAANLTPPADPTRHRLQGGDIISESGGDYFSEQGGGFPRNLHGRAEPNHQSEAYSVLPLFLIAAVTTVGGFSYKTVTLSERAKQVSSAPDGYPATWKEHVEAVVGTSPADRDFTAYMKRRAVEMQKGYYQDDSTPHGTLRPTILPAMSTSANP